MPAAGPGSTGEVLSVQHRHILPGHEDSIPAVEDVLARGTVEDWRELAQRVVADPDGPAAQALQAVLDHVHMYGTTVIWRDVLDDVRRAASRR